MRNFTNASDMLEHSLQVLASLPAIDPERFPSKSAVHRQVAKETNISIHTVRKIDQRSMTNPSIRVLDQLLATAIKLEGEAA